MRRRVGVLGETDNRTEYKRKSEIERERERDGGRKWKKITK